MTMLLKAFFQASGYVLILLFPFIFFSSLCSLPQSEWHRWSYQDIPTPDNLTSPISIRELIRLLAIESPCADCVCCCGIYRLFYFKKYLCSLKNIVE